jgi:AraC-like DNA-binding protein
MNLTAEQQSRMENIIHDIPVIPEGTMEQYAKMLHFALTGQTTDQTPFHFFKQEVKAEKFFDESKVTYEDLRGDGVPLSRVTMTEEELLSFIRNGKFDRRRISTLKDNIVPPKFTDDVVLNAKYEFVAFASRASSAAVEGGLPIRISKTLELQLVRLLSHCRKMTDIKGLSTMMMIEYTSRVRHCKENPNLSEVVILIQDYIQNNLTNSISLSDLSKQFGYTEYYLSRRFNKETGQRISDYLNHERIEYSKNLLLNTDLSIQEISQVLQYENFSYFGQLFKKQVGQTPQEYRSSPGQKFKETYPFETKNLN